MNEMTWVELVVADSSPGHDITATALFFEATGVVLLVLILLLLASVATWAIIGYKWLSLRRAMAQTRAFQEIFWQSKRLDGIYKEAENLPHSPASNVFRAGFVELRKLKNRDSSDATMRHHLGDMENVDRALKRAMATQINRMERQMPFLATVGATAPFVGLFGTVWGIMLAFMEIAAAGEAGLDVVSGPIAEALIATAIGLVAAIPAVIAFNFFNARIRSLEVDLENFASDFLNIVKRHFY